MTSAALRARARRAARQNPPPTLVPYREPAISGRFLARVIVGTAIGTVVCTITYAIVAFAFLGAAFGAGALLG